MNKKLIIGAATGGAVLAAVAAKRGPTRPKPSMWEKMRQHMKEMPPDFPPRIMFDNIEIIKANTGKILERLEGKEPSKDDIRATDNT